MTKTMKIETAAVAKYLKSGGQITKLASKAKGVIRKGDVAIHAAIAKAAKKPAKAKPVAKKTKVPAKTKSGGAYAGKKLFLTKKTNGENVRKPGTQGHAALEIVRKNPGVLYEDYVKQIKRSIPGSVHLRWEIAHGHLELK